MATLKSSIGEGFGLAGLTGTSGFFGISSSSGIEFVSVSNILVELILGVLNKFLLDATTFVTFLLLLHHVLTFQTFHVEHTGTIWVHITCLILHHFVIGECGGLNLAIQIACFDL